MNTRSLPNVFSRRRRSSLRGAGAVLLAALACAAMPASAQSGFPNKPVKLIVAFPPGGAVDGIGRDIAKGLSDLWGQPVIVENKPGAAGVIAADSTAKAPPDGYTLFLATDGITVVVPFLQSKMPYDTLTDLKPIAMVGTIPLILVASPSAKFKTVAELVAQAKAMPDGIDYASNGVGVSPHMAMEHFQRTADIKLNHIPYKGSAQAFQDVLGGRVPVMWAAVSVSVPHIQAGKLAPLAIGSVDRLPLLPNVPTVSELGYRGFEAATWIGVMGPGKLPDALTQKIQADLRKVTQNAAYRERQIATGNEVRGSTSEEFAKRIAAEYSRNKALFANGGIARE
jgi:tripartite-type tricarboxylate transporter receptor subunit TctC